MPLYSPGQKGSLWIIKALSGAFPSSFGFHSVLSVNFLAVGKTLDSSSLHPYQELRPTGGREGSLDSPADIMNSLEMVIWPVLSAPEQEGAAHCLARFQKCCGPVLALSGLCLVVILSLPHLCMLGGQGDLFSSQFFRSRGIMPKKPRLHVNLV